MIDNVKLSIIHGGYFHCTPAWSASSENKNFDKIFSFWMPASGEALMETRGGNCRLKPGHVYFIPSHHLVSQTCEKEMWVYWITFTTESYYLHYRLLGLDKTHAWPLASLPWVETIFKRSVSIFENAGDAFPQILKDPPMGLTVKIEGALMHLVGDLIEATDKDFCWGNFAAIERLKPAIDFMDQHYLRNPSLAQIAETVRFEPHYFHSIFKKHAGITPFAYMENRRLDLARKLLFNRQLSIKEVAAQSGYRSLNYFSRAFSRRFGTAPSVMRKGGSSGQ